MTCRTKLLKLKVCVLSLVNANIICFLLGFPNNPHFNSVDVFCLTNTQSTRKYQWKTNKPLEFTLFKDPLPFGSSKFIWQRKKLWRTCYKERECRSLRRHQWRKGLCTQAQAMQAFGYPFSFPCCIVQDSDCASLCFGTSRERIYLIWPIIAE